MSQLSVVTFTEAFAADNRKEDMDQYLAVEMSPAKLIGELQDSNNLFLIAWHNDEPVGYAKMAMGTKNESKQLERPIELERIYVLKKHYGKKAGAHQGIGSFGARPGSADLELHGGSPISFSLFRRHWIRRPLSGAR